MWKWLSSPAGGGGPRREPGTPGPDLDEGIASNSFSSSQVRCCCCLEYPVSLHSCKKAWSRSLISAALAVQGRFPRTGSTPRLDGSPTGTLRRQDQRPGETSSSVYQLCDRILAFVYGEESAAVVDIVDSIFI